MHIKAYLFLYVQEYDMFIGNFALTYTYQLAFRLATLSNKYSTEHTLDVHYTLSL